MALPIFEIFSPVPHIYSGSNKAPGLSAQNIVILSSRAIFVIFLGGNCDFNKWATITLEPLNGFSPFFQGICVLCRDWTIVNGFGKKWMAPPGAPPTHFIFFYILTFTWRSIFDTTLTNGVLKYFPSKWNYSEPYISSEILRRPGEDRTHHFRKICQYF
jgi:hypothetical protein